MRAPIIGAFVALVSGLVIGQAPPKEEFEVAAIRPFNQGPGPGFRGGVKGGPGTNDPILMTFTNSSITNLVVLAYSIKNYQLTAPAWMNEKEARYNIQARVRPGATKEQANEMIKNLLADRFKLVLRRETKEMPVHVITIAKGGPRLKESADDPQTPASMGAADMVPTGTRRIVASGKTIDDLAAKLSEPYVRLGPVLDKTGLTKKYDFTLEFALSDEEISNLRVLANPNLRTQPPDFPQAPELKKAMEEQLGLTIQATKGPVEIFTVVSVSKSPTEN
jgi:uncharacterized protein (TIGR03435 family)